MTKFLSLALVLTLASLQTSCSLLQQQNNPEEKDKAEEKERMPPPLHLGSVHQIFPEKGFALLRIIGPLPREGAVLISHPADGATDRVGNLIVSGGQHRRGNMIVADIRSGTVIKGDRVFLYRSISDTTEEEELPTEESDNEIDDTTVDNGEDSPLPDFSSTSAITDEGSNPFFTQSNRDTPPPAPVREQEETSRSPQQESGSGVPDKLLDIPDTLDGWN